MDNYRVDECGSVYELNGDSYWFIGKLNGESLEEFLDDHDGE